MKNENSLVAVITGASQGIGFAIASYLASLNYKLLLISRNHANLERASRNIGKENPNLKYIPSIAAVDVSDLVGIQKCIEDFVESEGHIDLLCNSAGYVKRGTSDLAHDEFMKMINANLIGPFNCIQSVAKYMKKRGSGRIINISSRSGKVAKKMLGGYSASKFGLMGLNQSYYKELAGYGVYVTAICPNLVATDMTSDVNMPREEMTQTRDVVKAVEFLLGLNSSVSVEEIVMQCRSKLLEEQ